MNPDTWTLTLTYPNGEPDTFTITKDGRLTAPCPSDAHVLTRLLGFALQPFTNQIDLTTDAAIATPRNTVGMRPVFDTTDNHPTTLTGTTTRLAPAEDPAMVGAGPHTHDDYGNQVHGCPACYPTPVPVTVELGAPPTGATEFLSLALANENDRREHTGLPRIPYTITIPAEQPGHRPTRKDSTA